ncbi:maleate cis-trans isomerase family protein [Actinoplanes derwentensis]|uniref:Maleate isomerase n=1 Tax=Actinoplanes derwentensis TaxID=113562 RepID=A0A1H1ZSY4_9ACTN|nr:arylmalonate decarboxylase [Actinoplanes derwentensis]GID89186.1 igiC [Actinoplanes derwentensis]SDT36512.1 maleate isomerase [Actinoplanes derwentensis]
MTTVTSPRAVLGVIVPSTNTVVEAEYNDMRPPGVSFHTGRIYIAKPGLGGDDDMVAFLEDLRTQLDTAVRDVVTCLPDRIVMGMSAETFWGGAAGNADFEKHIREISGLEVSSGAAACDAALKAFGARRIAVITPYQPVGDEQVRTFFTDLGYDVAAVRGFKCDSATSIADVTPAEIRAAFLEVDAPDVDVLVQAGTNLAAVAVAAELEAELGKPVIAINAATVWHALRAQGIPDQLTGHGRLLADH